MEIGNGGDLGFGGSGGGYVFLGWNLEGGTCTVYEEISAVDCHLFERSIFSSVFFVCLILKPKKMKFRVWEEPLA